MLRRICAGDSSKERYRARSPLLQVAEIKLAARLVIGFGAIGLCVFDLDHFKGYNDHYGHPAGDEVLRRVSACVNTQLKRSIDRLFRVGGEEFAVLMSTPDCTQVAVFIDSIRRSIETMAIPHRANAAGVVTASFGLAWCSDAAMGDVDDDALYRCADEMLYRAKAEGRNRVVSGEFLAQLHDAKRA